MAVLTRLEIEKVARRHFGDLGEQHVAVATAIALAESGGDTDALNDNWPRWQTADSPARWDKGLMQINSIHGYGDAVLYNPDGNMSAARAIYDLQGWGAWTTWRWGMAQPLIQDTTPEEPITAPILAPSTWTLSPEIGPSPADPAVRARFVTLVYQKAYGYNTGAEINPLNKGPQGQLRYEIVLPAS